MEKYLNETIASIRNLLKIDSSNQPAEKDMPFGKGTYDALRAFLNLANDLGFETKNYDNYVGEVIFGNGEDFAILAHLDVVPAGNGWTHEPFGAEMVDGKIFGRGAMDDKGPAIICLYALKALKDANFTPNKRIKLIVGCNEESGWGCIEHYKQNAVMPKYGFTPDADFPVIYAEKGILGIKMKFPIHNAPFSALYGGTARNMVCAEAFVECDVTSDFKAFKLAKTDNGLASYGISAHGSTPEKGVNALNNLLAYFATQNKCVKDAYDVLFNDKFGFKKFEDETGKLTFSPNIAKFENGVLNVWIDIRYPATLPFATILSALDATNIDYEVVATQSALYNDKNDFLITTLLKVYNEETGEKAEPIAIGGGTYARALECGAGFGPQLLSEMSTIHQADEYISVSHILFLLKLYKRAIKELTK